MLTAEYTVLRGATALSLPTKFGQFLSVEKSQNHLCQWRSLSPDGQAWFSASFTTNLELDSTSNREIAQRLLTLLRAAKSMNPTFISESFSATTTLQFDRNWGLGSSSTLVALVAQWAEINALDLFFKSQTGSGYDVATAQANSPIFYTLKNQKPSVEKVNFSPLFKSQLFFVHLGKKQRSDREVAKFSTKDVSPNIIAEITTISQKIVESDDLNEFKKLILAHENLTSEVLGFSKVQEYFPANFPFQLKSLGAWGGDFVLAIGHKKDLGAFAKAGFKTVLSWDEMILS